MNPEDVVQIHLVKKLLRDGYLVHGDQNGVNKSMQAAMKAKLMGMRAGWPDITVILPASRIFFIEVKVSNPTKRNPNGYSPLTQSQRDLHPVLASLGHPVYIFHCLSPIIPSDFKMRYDEMIGQITSKMEEQHGKV